MITRGTTHATFVIERTWSVPPARVFAAWSDPKAKARWFGGGDHALDFRIGGREESRGGEPGEPVYIFRAVYQDIVPGERIIYNYEMYLGETRISVSLATVEFQPHGGGTRLVFTEQGAFLDGHDTPAQREEGTRGLLDALGKELS